MKPVLDMRVCTLTPAVPTIQYKFAQVYKVSLWLGQYKAATAKRITLWSSTPRVSGFWSSKKFNMKEFKKAQSRQKKSSSRPLPTSTPRERSDGKEHQISPKLGPWAMLGICRYSYILTLSENHHLLLCM